MLIFNFRKEFINGAIVFRPRLNVRFKAPHATIEVFALLDSGADRSIVPEAFAELLHLKKGSIVETSGVGGNAKGYESEVDIVFTDVSGNTERVASVPIYVLPDFNDVVIGRSQIFELFSITFEQFNKKIFLEKKPD